MILSDRSNVNFGRRAIFLFLEFYIYIKYSINKYYLNARFPFFLRRFKALYQMFTPIKFLMANHFFFPSKYEYPKESNPHDKILINRIPHNN